MPRGVRQGPSSRVRATFDLATLVATYSELVEKETGRPLIQDPREQLYLMVLAAETRTTISSPR